MSSDSDVQEDEHHGSDLDVPHLLCLFLLQFGVIFEFSAVVGNVLKVTPPSDKTRQSPTERLVITHIEVENFKSYYGKHTFGPFHKVRLID